MHNQIKLEEEVMEFWKKRHIYRKAKEKNKEGEVFFFCDGPPYATGQIHPGTAWNKCLKDSVCRYKRMNGFNVRAQPGYDTHGLPIEVKVEQEMKILSKKEIEERVGIENFIKKCKEFASRHVKTINGQFERCGVWMDFENPYITYKNSYIESSWKTIKKAHEKGLLARGVYVLPYCARCETTLANYELEYADETDPSIYVKFKLKDSEEYLVIWTTTPWTLVSNMAVMVHPTFTYVKAKVDGETWIVAKERLDALMAFANSSATVLGELSGKKLEGLRYEHPIQGKMGKEYDRRVVLSDEFVTIEDGSGLVHCAPGHGPQDFIIGKRFDIEIFSPIDSAGKFTKEAGEYAGMRTKDAGERAIADLEACGALIYAGKIRHRYPHCWRCKTKLIYLTTDQWFITVSKLKEKMLEEIEKCTWQPAFAKTRFTDFVQAAPDWCISRQRYWGIPLPIWICGKCGDMKVIDSVKELGAGVDDLHKPQLDKVEFKCAKCDGKMKRTPDILDVWFDSGNAVWAQFEKGEKEIYPANVIIEGKDQTRGWFYSLLGSGVVLHDQIPYSALLMHGFFVDEKGEKMSKSVGNFVPLEEIVEKNGVDSFRLWSLSSTVWDDLRFSWDEIREAGRSLGIIYNLGVYLQRFYPKKKIQVQKFERLEDLYILSRLESTRKECTQAFEEYRVHDAAKAVRKFIVEDLSRFYLKLAKKREDEEALAVAYECVLGALVLASPIIPYTCDAVYREFFSKYEDAESIHLVSWKEPDEKRINKLLERRMQAADQIITSAINARQKGNVKLRWPLEEIIVSSNETEVKDTVSELCGIICEMANVRNVRAGKVENVKLSLELNFAKIGEKFREESKAVARDLEHANAEQVALAFAKDGKFMLKEKYEITKEMALVKEEAEGYAIAEFEGGKVYLKTKMNKELMREAMVREVARRVQMERKKIGLVEKDKISLEIACGGELREHLEAGKKELSEQVNAAGIKFEGKMKDAEEFEIEGEKVSIKVKKE